MALQLPPDEAKAGAPDWMVTFADLMSLLLTFFVLLLSFSTMSEEAFNAATGSIKSAFGMKSEISLINKPAGQRLTSELTDRPERFLRERCSCVA